MTDYRADEAWRRALMFFSVCIAVAAFAGTLRMLFTRPPVLPGQWVDAAWWLATAFVSVYTVFAYAWYWPQGTVTHGRPLRPIAATLFGCLWGFCQGALLLSAFLAVASLQFGTVPTVLITFAAYAVFAGLWQSRYWDVYVSPPHNIESWNLRKVLVCHVPFLLLALAHLSVYGNAAIFIVWQMLALTASCRAMHFPAPGDRQ